MNAHAVLRLIAGIVASLPIAHSATLVVDASKAPSPSAAAVVCDRRARRLAGVL